MVGWLLPAKFQQSGRRLVSDENINCKPSSDISYIRYAKYDKLPDITHDSYR